MRYTVELLGYDEHNEDYVYIALLKDFGLDFKGAKSYAKDLAYNHTEEVIAEVRRKSKTLAPFLISVNRVHNGYGSPMFGYEYDGQIEKVTL